MLSALSPAAFRPPEPARQRTAERVCAHATFSGMDPRSAAHTLLQIAAFLELRGESKFKVKAYEQAAKSIVTLDTDDLAALDRSGELAQLRGLGKATLSVVRDLIETGESRYLDQLRGETPEGLLDLLQVPGLATPKINLLYQELGVDSVDALEIAIRNGKLTTLKGFGPKTAERILRGIEVFRTSGTMKLHFRAAEEARAIVAAVRAHPDVVRAEVAGSVRRHRETVGDVDVVAECSADPVVVAMDFAEGPGVKKAENARTASPKITYVDGAHLDLHCVSSHAFVMAFWRATGSSEHVAAVIERLASRGFALRGDTLMRGDTPVE